MSASRHVLMVVPGGLTGVLLAWLLLPVVFERDGLTTVLAVALLVIGVAPLVRAIQRGRTRA